MTEDARPGTPHEELPAGIRAADLGGLMGYIVVPWHCPSCDDVVAQTAIAIGTVEDEGYKAFTKPTHYSPRRWPQGDEDGVRLYGPTKRGSRDGKGERRKADRLEVNAYRRAEQEREGGQEAPPADHAAIQDETFLLLCDNCPRKLRVRLAIAIPVRP